MKNILSIENLTINYKTKKGNIQAVSNVSCNIQEGEIVGLLGESGCGKTTLGYSILKLLPQNAKILQGKIIFNGKDILNLPDNELRNIRWKEISVIFQSAMNSLNPVLRVGEQIEEAILTHNKNIKKDDVKSHIEKLYSIVGIDKKFINQYPHEYSGGMRQRAIIAMALALKPKLLIADEPTTALDVLVQAQILNELKKIQTENNLSIFFISHDILLLSEISHRLMIMYAGKIVEIAKTENILKNPLHPYTKGLLLAYPTLSGKKKLIPIDGEPPNLISLPSGCSFHPRCKYRKDICFTQEPELKNYEEHYVACHLIQ